MAIVFHEGLPGAGKSYEACVYHILPSLKNARPVLTNIEGINHEKFSELTKIPIAWVKKYLKCVYDQDVDKQKQLILEETEKDSLIVIDEIQNLFPSDRQKLSAEWMRYISEHRHEGLDIVLMGQDRRDCHAMWRRRIQRVITFNKLDGLGMENSYAWQCFNATRPEKFQRASGGRRTYKDKYFGLYESVTQGTENTDVYSDDRSNLLKTNAVKFWIPLFLIVVAWAFYSLTTFFTSDAQADEEGVTASSEQPRDIPLQTVVFDLDNQPIAELKIDSSIGQTSIETGGYQYPQQQESEQEKHAIDIFDEYASEYRLRMSAFVEFNGGLFAYIDVLDDTLHLQDRFTLDQLESLGWSIEHQPYGLIISKEDIEHIVRQWPRDDFGRVNQQTRSAL